MAHKTSRIKVYLSDLANTYFGTCPGTIPIAAGYLGAYLNKKFGEEVEVRIFRTLPPLLDQASKEPPDLAGFSVYAWNPRLTEWALRQIKAIHPHTLTVVGGPSVELSNETNAEYLKQHPTVDFLVRHEGEFALANIVEAYMDRPTPEGVKTFPIDGTTTWMDGRLVAGRAIPQIEDLNGTVPSPYLTGMLDDLLKDPALVPIVQTTRGCPYACTFCVSGQPIYNRLRSFGVDRVKEELLYLSKKAANRSIRFSDDNFGLLAKDLEIAQFVRRLYDTEGYPLGVKIYYGKLISERIKQCALLLKPLLPLCMSFQSLTPEVLEEVERPNNTRAKFEEARRWARAHDVTVATELIYGLPRETYASFLQTVDDVVDLRVDSVFMGGLRLLDGAGVNSKQRRADYGFKTKYIIGDDGVTVIGSQPSVEAGEFVIGTNWLSEDEFFKLKEVDLFATFCIGYGFFKEVLYHCATSGIAFSQLFTELDDHPETYPALGGLLRSYGEASRGTYADTIGQLDTQVTDWVRQGKAVESPQRLRGAYAALLTARKDAVLQDLRRAVLHLGKKLPRPVDPAFEEVTHMLCDLSQHLLMPIEADLEETISWKCSYDLVRWVREDYQLPLSRYSTDAPLEFSLVMNNFAQARAVNESLRGESEESKPILFLRRVTSSNIRRQIRYATVMPTYHRNGGEMTEARPL